MLVSHEKWSDLYKISKILQSLNTFMVLWTRKEGLIPKGGFYCETLPAVIQIWQSGNN